MPNILTNRVQLFLERYFKTERHTAMTEYPRLEGLNYQLVFPPPNQKLEAWAKLKESERRLIVYRWAEKLNDPRKADRRVTLNDAVSAFLLTLEATLQFVKDQFESTPNAPHFENWLRQQSQYDILIKGLRTLRHFEAHVEQRPPGRMIIATIGGSNNSVSATWHLPQLNAADLGRLRTPPLTNAELPAWNQLAANTKVDSTFERGVVRLGEILNLAEAIV